MKLVVIIFLVFSGFLGVSQEIKCDVSIIAPTLKSDPANTEILLALENSVFEFINSKKWTDDNYEEQERIDMSILITINTKSGSDFNGNIQISSSRPVYNSDYQTRLFSFLDEKMAFSYNRGEALIFTPDRSQSNLSDVVAFYVYMVLGYDYDSFSPKGGTKYFVLAQQIVGRSQNSSAPGWKPTEGKKNRFTLVDNALNNAFNNLRTCYYDYHRKGFDMLYTDNETAIKNIVESLKLLEIIHKTQPNSINVQIFFTAKADEIVALFKDMDEATKNQVYMIVTKLDPGNIAKYNLMKKS